MSADPYAFHAYVGEEGSDYVSLHHATPERLAAYQWPPGVKTISIYSDYLDRLVVPDGVETALLGCIGLRELVLPDSVEHLNVERNFLTRLELPRGIERVLARDNLLEEVTFRGGGDPTALVEMDLRANRLRRLRFEVPECTLRIDVMHNADLVDLDVSDSVAERVRRPRDWDF